MVGVNGKQPEARHSGKQMRLGPATQAALLSRIFPTAVFRQGRKSSRAALGERDAAMPN